MPSKSNIIIMIQCPKKQRHSRAETTRMEAAKMETSRTERGPMSERRHDFSNQSQNRDTQFFESKSELCDGQFKYKFQLLNWMKFTCSFQTFNKHFIDFEKN